MSSIHPALPTTEYELLSIDRIRTDGGTQSRTQLDWIAIDEYAAIMRTAAAEDKPNPFPPVVVFYDGEVYWLADGFHRVQAAGYADLTELAADIRQGTKRDAILHSAGANHDHGVRRTNGDKRRAVELVLEITREDDPPWSDREVARWTGTVNSFVSGIRISLFSKNSDNGKRKRKDRWGNVSTIDTTNIGKGKAIPPDPEPLALPLDQPTEEPDPEPKIVTRSILMPRVINADARRLADFVTEPVHLVVTSPPYNVGIEYAQTSDNVTLYLEWLKSIWSQCHAVMIDGARIAVVVPFGVGRNPWVPFACQIMETLTGVGFTLRGQIIWDKGTSGGRTSWGSFRMSSDPSLRDTTEAIVIAHKGDSKLPLPADLKFQDDKGTHTAALTESDYFMELAQDHWIVPPESASRVKHPAPFPVELVKRLIDFYAYPGAHVLDPFGGSGTTAIAAQRCGCTATLIEIDADYCRLARERLANHDPE